MRRLSWFLCGVLLAGAGMVWAEPLTYTGTVLGPDGKPVAGASILTMRYQAGGELTSFEMTTNATGAFSVQSDPLPYAQAVSGLLVLARKEGLAAALGTAKAGTPLVLKLGGTPEERGGVVRDAGGKPVVNAAVVVSQVMAEDRGGQYGMSVPGLSLSNVKTVTDDQGRFAFPGFGPGMSLRAAVGCEGFANAAIRLRSADPVTVVLQAEAKITGTVLVGGQPRAGLRLHASSLGPAPVLPASGETGADGTYTLRGLGPGPVRVEPPPVEGMARLQGRTVTLLAGQTVAGVDFSLTPGGTVRGKVTDEETGQPVAKAMVIARASGDPRSQTATAQSREDGSYELRLAPGEYVITGQASGVSMMVMTGPGPVPASPTLTVREGEGVEGHDLQIRLPRQVRVQVLLPDGSPAALAQVQRLGGYGLPGPLKLDERGEMQVEVPPPPSTTTGMVMTNDITLIFRDEARSLAAYAVVKADSEDLSVSLQPAAQVTCVVTDTENRPLENIGLSIAYPYGSHGWMSQGGVVSDALGTVVFRLLPAGLKLHFMPDQSVRHLLVSGDPQRLDVVLNPGEQRLLPPLVINPAGRSLNVFVGDPEGKPIKGAEVYAQGLQTPSLTDAEGKVALTRLPLQGKVMLLGVDPAREWYALENADPGGGVWPGLLVRPLGKVTGMLIAKGSGKPVAGVGVTCQPMFSPWQMGTEAGQRMQALSRGMPGATTDADGRFEVAGLIAGAECYLMVQGKPGAPQPMVGRMVLKFKATGGPEVQDLGAVEVEGM